MTSPLFISTPSYSAHFLWPVLHFSFLLCSCNPCLFCLIFLLVFFWSMSGGVFVPIYKSENLRLRIKGGIFGTYMSKASLVLAGYSAVRRNPGCSISASLTLLQIPAWNFHFSFLDMGIRSMEGILSKDLHEGICSYRRHQRIYEDWTEGYRISVFILQDAVNTCLSGYCKYMP